MNIFKFDNEETRAVKQLRALNYYEYMDMFNDQLENDWPLRDNEAQFSALLKVGREIAKTNYLIMIIDGLER